RQHRGRRSVHGFRLLARQRQAGCRRARRGADRRSCGVNPMEAGGDFTAEQRRYLEGLVAGMSAARAPALATARAEPKGPDVPHLIAMARTEAEGRKLVDQEKFKRDEHPLDAYTRLKGEAA